MTEETVEVSLKQFFNSTWFKGIARIGFLLFLPVAGYMWHEFEEHDNRIAAIERDRATRIVKSDERAKAVDNAILNMTSIQTSQASDINAIKREISALNGKLSILIRQKDAGVADPSLVYDGIFPVATE